MNHSIANLFTINSHTAHYCIIVTVFAFVFDDFVSRMQGFDHFPFCLVVDRFPSFRSSFLSCFHTNCPTPYLNQPFLVSGKKQSSG